MTPAPVVVVRRSEPEQQRLRADMQSGYGEPVATALTETDEAMLRSLAILMLMLVSMLTLQPCLNAQTQQPEVQALEQRVHALENDMEAMAPGGLVMFLFGCFCALWAQNNGRSAWGWFFLGLFFGPITAVVLLVKNPGGPAQEI
jgi:hypothetical protein